MSNESARRFPPEPGSSSAARSFATDRLAALGRSELAEDVELLLAELTSNAIMHARTAFAVSLARTQEGVRVEVSDGSPTMPAAGTLAISALSGRGLTLVDALSSRWGARRDPGGGKTVWFEVAPGTRQTRHPDDVDALMAMWDDSADYPARGRAPSLVEVVVPDLPVQRLVAAKARMEDLLREVQLLLLGHDARPDQRPDMLPLLEVARRLEAAARDFAEGRRQVRLHALEAAARGEDRVTLRLHLPLEAAGAAVRYSKAIEEAERLNRVGHVLTAADTLVEHAGLRRQYLNAIIDQLSRSGAAGRCGTPS